MTFRSLSLTTLLAGALLFACGGYRTASGHQATVANAAAANVFVASRERPFDVQMMETMSRMDAGMATASMSGDPDHDFVTMMIPHHQGGIDMAEVLLVHGKDPAMMRLAQAIVTDQENEIELMRLWLQKHDRAVLDAKENAP